MRTLIIENSVTTDKTPLSQDERALLMRVFLLRYTSHISIARACESVGLPRSTYYGWLKTHTDEVSEIETAVSEQFGGDLKAEQVAMLEREAEADLRAREFVLRNLDAYMERLGDIALNSRSDKCAVESLKLLFELSRGGIVLPKLPAQQALPLAKESTETELPQLPAPTQSVLPTALPPTRGPANKVTFEYPDGSTAEFRSPEANGVEIIDQ